VFQFLVADGIFIYLRISFHLRDVIFVCVCFHLRTTCAMLFIVQRVLPALTMVVVSLGGWILDTCANWGVSFGEGLLGWGVTPARVCIYFPVVFFFPSWGGF